MWMLDTDTVSFALRGEGGVAAELRQRTPAEIRVSSITAAELWFGVERRRSTKLRRIVSAFLDSVEVLPFDAAAAQRYGKVAAILADRGKTIGAFDAMIAAHALLTKAVLVTHNLAHFRQVPGLAIDDWY